jgi:hypothetical protein
MGSNYKHLSYDVRTISGRIMSSEQRAPSSISRELKLNGRGNPATAPRRREAAAKHQAMRDGRYCGGSAAFISFLLCRRP